MKADIFTFNFFNLSSPTLKYLNATEGNRGAIINPICQLSTTQLLAHCPPTASSNCMG